jgi:hypothetical protein
MTTFNFEKHQRTNPSKLMFLVEWRESMLIPDRPVFFCLFEMSLIHSPITTLTFGRLSLRPISEEVEHQTGQVGDGYSG